MKINSKIKITGDKVILVPYRESHVPKYHEWMKSEELQLLTASEPLTLSQEFEMQKSWLEDEDKCTFIILDKFLYEKEFNEIESMVGDTNLFLEKSENKGEIEIMIAEPLARGKKYGWEAVVIMLLYGIQNIHLTKFEAKISLQNCISIKMFNKLGFNEKCRSDIFQEVTLEKHVDEEWLKWLNKQISFKLEEYA